MVKDSKISSKGWEWGKVASCPLIDWKLWNNQKKPKLSICWWRGQKSFLFVNYITVCKWNPKEYIGALLDLKRDFAMLQGARAAWEARYAPMAQHWATVDIRASILTVEERSCRRGRWRMPGWPVRCWSRLTNISRSHQSLTLDRGSRCGLIWVLTVQLCLLRQPGRSRMPEESTHHFNFKILFSNKCSWENG